jgi:hypothetical protein
MTIYITLLSSAQIGRDEWHSFLQAAGTERIDRPHNPYEGVLRRDQGKIWVAMDNGVVEDIDPDDEQLIRLLGGTPETAIVMEISSTPGSSKLALEFACRFAEQWPCVVETEHQCYSSQDLFDLYQSSHSFLRAESQQ